MRRLVGVEHPRRQQLEGEAGQPRTVQGVEQRDCRDVGVEEGRQEAGPPVGEGLPESLRGENTRIGRSLQHENHLHARKGGGGRRPSPAAQEGAGGEPSPSRREFGARIFEAAGADAAAMYCSSGAAAGAVVGHLRRAGSGTGSGVSAECSYSCKGTRLRCSSKGRCRDRGRCRHRHRRRSRCRGRIEGSQKLLLRSYFFTARPPSHLLCNFCLPRFHVLLALRGTSSCVTAFTEHLSPSQYLVSSLERLVSVFCCATCCLLCALLLWESAGVVLLERSQVVMQEVSCFCLYL